MVADYLAAVSRDRFQRPFDLLQRFGSEFASAFGVVDSVLGE